MSAFPMGSNVAHVRRYGNARNLRQMSEPAGVVTPKSTSTSRARSSSPGTIKVNHSSTADSPNKAEYSPVHHMQHSLKLGQHIGRLTPFLQKKQQGSLVSRSISVDTVSCNILPLNVVGLVCSKQHNPLPINIRNTDKQNVGLSPNKDDSGFGSALNVSPLAIDHASYGLAGLGLTTSCFIKTGGDSVSSLQCVINALQKIATHQN